jgi:ABC-type Fe3+/spermidine/putrescine transport system ATPase subunit
MRSSTFVTEPVPSVAPAPAQTAVVSGHHLVKRFGSGTSAVDALRGVDVAFAPGSFTAIMGPSGSGKSTLLHILAGLDRPTDGWVEIDGTRLDRLNDRDLTLLRRRSVGFVFQAYNLLPVLTAEENITLPLRIGGKRPDREWLETLIEAVGLGDRRTHRPAEMSGGQQQRVALARALVTKPRVLLLDEPLGALDKRLRQQMQIELRQIQREVGITTIFVTHDQEEALTLSDRIAIFNEGKVVQVGAPHAVYERPSSAFAASFLGDANFFAGRVSTAGGQIETDGGRRIATFDSLPPAGARITVAVRPEKMLLEAGTAGERDTPNRWPGVVKQAVYSGSSISYRVDVGTEIVVFAQNQSAQPLEPGTAVAVTWNPLHSVVVETSP